MNENRSIAGGNMKWCCILFENTFVSAGERGASLLVGRDYFGKPEFIVQHRTVDISVDDAPVTDYPMAWVSEAPIFFCPWCGQNLDKWYGAHVDKLSRPHLKIPEMKTTET